MGYSGAYSKSKVKMKLNDSKIAQFISKYSSVEKAGTEKIVLKFKLGSIITSKANKIDKIEFDHKAKIELEEEQLLRAEKEKKEEASKLFNKGLRE